MTLDADMKTRPILFNTDMIRALLDGRKTQTRRVIRKQPAGAWAAPGKTTCPYGQGGDLLWVRENFHYGATEQASAIWYVADGDPAEQHDSVVSFADYSTTKPSIHMPRWASRLTLKITGVRVEPVQHISQNDAVAEGIDDTRDMKPKAGRIFYAYGPRAGFSVLWNSINAKRGYSWESNPWVWVIKFECVKKNVDNYLKEAACSMK